MQASNITRHYLQLQGNGRFGPLLDSQFFWQQLASGQYPQLEQGMLCSAFEFDCAWTSWERHPAGDELVLLLQGQAKLILEREGVETQQLLQKNGDFVLVPAGVWHRAEPLTADNGTCTLLFLTPGAGTEHKPWLPDLIQE